MMPIVRNIKLNIFIRRFSTITNTKKFPDEIEILNQKFITDEWTNVTPQILVKVGKNLHLTPYHPLSHMRQRIVNYFYKAYKNKAGNPVFSVCDNLSPIVTVQQNFDSLLVPKHHSSRNKSDCYYINHDKLLRAHTTAHQAELINMGLDNFLIVGDVYRRDEIDSTHYPVFHQVDAVRLCTAEEVFKKTNKSELFRLFEDREDESDDKQAIHTMEAVKMMEYDMKTKLAGLAKTLFGKNVKHRWVDQYFPFTHPSWELEIMYDGDWMEILGCGIIRQNILTNCGVDDKIGWAFGLGLERLAMCCYEIPDIRLFWSTDTGFLKQFRFEDPDTNVVYQPISIYPQLANDISFWYPENNNFCVNDFYDIVREVGGDYVEQIDLIDEFVHPKTERKSQCYRIVYRHMERTLTQKEVNVIHAKIAETLEKELKVEVRNKKQ
ncbi:probable phenylalanine--tRNA ligase, mitochondrial [Chelonus insularis]|uniref:probable phenylalanine--tRNA ligase, mitochondrial n=1 Tax=Chelonus insularis TaxID=460826 RepID=UPI0015884359|nr:probable phenylalanine--tRNA ligase, mitochondrial [Chelonus insularis]